MYSIKYSFKKYFFIKIKMTVIYFQKRKNNLFIKIKELNENGKILKEVPLKNGQHHGLYKEYYNNGILRKQISFKNNKKNGYYKTFYENGNINLKIHYRDGLIQGNIQYYYENGVLGIESVYSLNKKNGRMKFYNKEGQIYLLKTFKDNIPHGKEIEFFNFFEIHRIYKNGERSGIEKNYLKLNNTYFLFKSIQWRSNQKNGKTIFYDINGNIQTIVPYRSGEIHGFKKIFSNGELEKTIQYCKGKVLYKFYSNKKEDICCICYDTISYQTKCNHFICKSCFYKMNNNKCPICRSILY